MDQHSLAVLIRRRGVNVELSGRMGAAAVRGLHVETLRGSWLHSKVRSILAVYLRQLFLENGDRVGIPDVLLFLEQMSPKRRGASKALLATRALEWAIL